jgi:hypothetical protein
MKSFHCDSCDMLVFFQNDHCVKCGHPLGFLPEVLDLSSLEKVADNQWRASSSLAAEQIYRPCANGTQFGVCNWMISEDDSNPFCIACRLNEVIPNLDQPKNIERWKKVELAKRRCIYTFLKLGLPFANSAHPNQPALSFRFLEDIQNKPVKTGHENGIITVNVAEADEDEREHRRLAMHEPYRTLVGHLRHESGHFYWNRLVANSPNLIRFRELFGDENLDYNSALQTHYKQGPPAEWPERNITAYASSHPWEDWAETWAHYLHVIDTLEAAASFGVGIDPDNTDNGNGSTVEPIFFEQQKDFDSLMTEWIPLTSALNSINRGMGLPDLYPFVTPPAVMEKLRFIHQLIHESKELLPKLNKSQLQT